MKYGIYDTVDNCWLGNDKGPRLFADGNLLPGRVIRIPEGVAETLAKTAAQYAGVQLGLEPGRLEARVYTGDANVLKDEVEPIMSFAEAMRKTIGGAL